MRFPRPCVPVLSLSALQWVAEPIAIALARAHISVVLRHRQPFEALSLTVLMRSAVSSVYLSLLVLDVAALIYAWAYHWGETSLARGRSAIISLAVLNTLGLIIAYVFLPGIFFGSASH